MSSSSSPTNFAPGDETGNDKYVLTVVDAGGGSDAGSPIEVSDTLPSGIAASAVSGEDLGNGHALTCSPTPKPTCSYEGFEMASGDVLRIEVTVKVNPAVAPSVTNAVSVSGGGASASAQAEDPTTVSSSEASFGIASFATTWSETQAGAAVNLTTGFTFNQVGSGGEIVPAKDAKDWAMNLPPGYIPDPLAAPMCTFSQAVTNSCPADSAVGVAFASIAPSGGGAPTRYSSLVYNTEPATGRLGRLAMSLPGVPVILDLAIREDGTYGVRVEADNLTQVVPLISMTMTLWGVPITHNGNGPDHVVAGSEQSFGGPGSGPAERFLTSPTACIALPDSGFSADSWSMPGVFSEATSPMIAQTGCNRLTVAPSLDISADSAAADEPSGYALKLQVPQSTSAEGLADSYLKNVAIALPQGASVSIAAANGMLGCGEAQAELRSRGPTTCPEGSKIGLAEVRTPLLGEPLKGAIYFATPSENPLKSPLAMYLVAENPVSGISLKLTGRIQADSLTGEPTIVFEELPQLPISELDLRFFGGARSLFTTPSSCGTATSTADLEPWSADASVTTSSSFQIETGPDDIPCGSPRPFSPVFLTEAKTTVEADTFASLALFVSRPTHDQEQELGSLTVEAPQALTQMFAGMQTCGEPDASQGICPGESKVGTITVTAGPNAYPVTLRGAIYLTGPYGGDPQGLSIALPVNPGPFELGTTVIRAGIIINPITGALVMASGQLRTLADGVPLHLDEILLVFDHGTFKVNPACESLGVTGTITSTEGNRGQIATDPLGVPSPPCPHPEPAPPQGGPQVSPVSPGTGTVGLLSPEIATSGRGMAKVKLACKGTARCLGSVTLTGKLADTHGKGHSKQETLGTAHFSLEPGATATVEVKLSAGARAALRTEHGYLRAVLSIRMSSPESAQTQSVTVRLSTHKIRRHAKR